MMTTKMTLRTIGLGALLSVFALSSVGQGPNVDTTKESTEVQDDAQDSKEALLAELRDERRILDNELEDMESDFQAMGGDISDETTKEYLQARKSLETASQELDVQIEKVEATADDQWESTKGDLQMTWKNTKTSLDNARRAVRNFFDANDEMELDD